MKLLATKINDSRILSQFSFCPGYCDINCKFQKGNVTYHFVYDSIERKLLKVLETDSLNQKEAAYYFNNDQLFYIRSEAGETYFRDMDFSVGNKWKDENDPFLIYRERQIAKAYKFIIMFNKGTAISKVI